MRTPICTFFIIFNVFGQPAGAIPTQGTELLISGPSPHVVTVAKEIQKAGGNVVDVAVGAALTLAVTSPYFAALGGGGFALVKVNGQVDVLDFREVAPKATHKDFYVGQEAETSIYGGKAVGVPGVPAGLWALHEKYGKLSWSKLFYYPMKLASEGFRVSGEWVQKTDSMKPKFNPSGRRIFFKENGENFRPGELLKQPKLATALRRFKSEKAKGFYEGQIAEDIVQAVMDAGGVISAQDLKTYKVRWLKPLTTQYEGYRFYLMPPPSSGGLVIQTALDLTNRVKLRSKPFLSADELHLLGEVLNRSFRGRVLLGDPDFFKNPLEQLTADNYLREMAKSIRLSRVVTLPPHNGFKEPNETTHFSVLDKNGNAVAFTVTLNGNYGSGVVSDRYGIALNNEMDDFTTQPGKANLYGLIQGKGNLVEAGKRPLSSMSPTLVEKDGKIVMSIGAPGGPRIISSVFQVIYRFIVNNLDIDQAIQAPRVHNQFDPAVLYVDEKRFSPDLIKLLEKRGHKVEPSWMGRVYAVTLDHDGVLSGAFDQRGEGAVGGY